MPGMFIIPKGGEAINAKLGNLADLAKKPSQPALASVVQLIGDTLRNFASQGNPKGPWDKLSGVSIFIRRHRAARPRKEGPYPIGNDTGRLRGSIARVFSEDGNLFGVGTNVEYAKD